MAQPPQHQPEDAAVPAPTDDVVPSDLAGRLAWAVATGHRVPRPGQGRTLDRWHALGAVAGTDLTLARVLEPHVDALAILAELGARPATPTSSYGVWAAEGAAPRLEGRQLPDGGWTLTGVKPWCSLAGHVDRALVTAWVGTRRGLFDVDARHPALSVVDAGWLPHGLSGVPTSSIDADRLPARLVGGLGDYLTRDGFAWGGMGVAAVWLGGAVAVARRVREQSRRREPDQVALMHLGALDAALAAARALVQDTAHRVDAGEAGGAAGVLLAAQVRQVVADVAELVLERAAHALGPGPLAHEPEHARRVADLALYVRQHHAERDQVALGRLVLDRPAPAGAFAW